MPKPTSIKPSLMGLCFAGLLTYPSVTPISQRRGTKFFLIITRTKFFLIITLEVKLWPRICEFAVSLELYLLHNMFWNAFSASSELTDGPQNYLTGKSGVLIKYQKKLTDLKWAGITKMFLSDKCDSGVRVCRPCWVIVDKSAFFWKGRVKKDVRWGQRWKVTGETQTGLTSLTSFLWYGFIWH